MTDTERRTILITGAGSGLGRALSLILGEAGHRILATDIDEESADETRRMLEAKGGEGTSGTVDVRSIDSVEAFLSSIDTDVDVLINNAGFQHVAPLEDFPQDRWDDLLDVVVKGTCVMTRAVLPGMRRNGFGRIVNIGSIHSLVASAYKTAYVTAKHALLGFSKVMALETADTDITINTICPSYIHTPLVDAQIKAQAKAHSITEDEVVQNIMLKPMPKKKFISFEEVAGTVHFLMSDHARNITGQSIAIDGGWTAQ